MGRNKKKHNKHHDDADADDSDNIVIIKKYANRRLYDTQQSFYITLDDLAAMVRKGKNFRVLDAKSNEDITHNILTQIIMDEEMRGQNLLPVNFLRQLIGMYGENMQSIIPQYLEESLSTLCKNQQDFHNSVQSVQDVLVENPLAELTKRNVEIFQKAASAFIPAIPEKTTSNTGNTGNTKNTASDDAEIARLQKRISELTDETTALQKQLAAKHGKQR